MARYTVDILDNSGQRLGFVPAPASPEYRRRQNQATSFSFGVLAEDETAPLLTYGRRCILKRDGVERAAGTVTRRDLSGQITRIECITDEALLRDLVTPADWNYWAGWELGDAVCDLLMECVVQARNTPEDWAAAVEKADVDLTTMPGQVVLAKNATGHYKSHGYITLQFDFGQITKYQVLRWSEDAGEQVRIKMQFRASTDATSWGAWSEELQSTFPAEDGVALTGSERFAQIRMHLYTDNTSAKDKNGVPTGYTPVLNGVEVIARRPGPLPEGAIEETAGVLLPAYRSENEDKKETYSFNRENALRILQTWCEDFGYEFRVDGQRRLYFGKDLGAKRSVVLRRTTNMDVKSLGDSADKLANVLHCYGAGDGPAQIRTVLRDRDSINLYGERIGTFEDSSADTLTKLTESGGKQLAKVAQPEPQFIVHQVPVHDLGEDLQLYDTVTVVDPRSGLVTAARILDEERKLSTSGEDVSFGLNSDLDNIIEKIVKGQAPRPRPIGLPPGPPADLRAATGYGYVQLTWLGDAAQFVVEHSSDAVSFDRLAPTLYRNYLHMGLEPGSTHHYRVIAADGAGSSAPSASVSAVVPSIPAGDLDQTPPAVPTGLTATTASDTQSDGSLLTLVSLTWDLVADSDLRFFAVRRRLGSDEWTRLGAIPAAPGAPGAYVDAAGLRAGATYEYQVTAGDAVGNWSEWSQGVTVAVAGDTTPPPAPIGLVGGFRGGDALFRWDPCPAPDYRQSLIEILTGGVVRRTVRAAATALEYTLEQNWADHGGEPAAPVTLRVSHFDASGNQSAASQVTAECPAPAMPDPPAVKPTFSALWIEIAPAADSAVSGHYVHITPSDGAGQALAGAVTAKIRVGKVTTYSYRASPNSSFLVAVSAFNALREGPVSEPAEGTTLALGVDAIAPGTIKSEHIEAGAITEAQTNWNTHLIF